MQKSIGMYRSGYNYIVSTYPHLTSVEVESLDEAMLKLKAYLHGKTETKEAEVKYTPEGKSYRIKRREEEGTS